MYQTLEKLFLVNVFNNYKINSKKTAVTLVKATFEPLCN